MQFYCVKIKAKATMANSANYYENRSSVHDTTDRGDHFLIDTIIHLSIMSASKVCSRFEVKIHKSLEILWKPSQSKNRTAWCNPSELEGHQTVL